VTAFTLAHLSDAHLSPLPGAGWRAYIGKRLSGYLSWTGNRAKIHQSRILKLLVDDLRAQQPDHTAVTGDLINLSLAGEFTAAAEWLETVGQPDRVTVIPGNHDAYVAMPWGQSLAHWAPYMNGARNPGEGEREPGHFNDFPFVRKLGSVALIGTSTAVPMPVFVAAGRLGREQLDRLRRQLTELGTEGLFRIVLIHHPPFGGGAYRRKSLLDASDFQDVLAEAGAELVLHGHTHVSGLGRIASPRGPIPVIGVPSASAVEAGHKDPARYHLYRIRRNAGSWSLEIDVRGLNSAADGFEAQGSMVLSIPLISSTSGSVSGNAA
jgi:3',5'-cyclic AMP phosphodiesterase CpdA